MQTVLIQEVEATTRIEEERTLTAQELLAGSLLTHEVVVPAAVLRPEDEIWMSEIFYAGGTTEKNISANDLVNDLKALGKPAFFVEDRNELLAVLRPHLTDDCVLLLMGARDPGLEGFAKQVWEGL